MLTRSARAPPALCPYKTAFAYSDASRSSAHLRSLCEYKGCCVAVCSMVVSLSALINPSLERMVHCHHVFIAVVWPPSAKDFFLAPLATLIVFFGNHLWEIADSSQVSCAPCTSCPAPESSQSWAGALAPQPETHAAPLYSLYAS